MASSHDPAVSVFPANVQSQNMGKESAMLLPSSPPANTVHIACTSSASASAASSSSNPIEKNFPASSLPLSKADAVAGGTTAVISSNKYVKLNVGGSLHYTTMGTLTKEDNMLRAMFSGRMVVLTDSEGWILIDRCGKHFSCILNYLRDSSIVLPDSRYEVAELLAEAKYYLIQGLISQCESALERKQMEADPICRVPIITSHREEQDLVRRTHKPIVKFMYNRGNNKYSYTNSSDDNMLKNIELFDKLSLRFNGRILFMKDIIGDEICVWSYYGHQRKVAEICCTSIVYATEKKQTKVEFPEARIYEETLNILLYEHDQRGHHHQHVVITTDPLPPPAPVANDPQQQQQGNPRSHNCQSDDDLDGGGGGDLQQQQQRNSQHRVRRIHVNSNRPV